MINIVFSRPNCNNEDSLLKMINSGTDAFRFNFAKYKRDFNTEALNFLRDAMSQKPDAKISLMFETQGLMF